MEIHDKEGPLSIVDIGAAIVSPAGLRHAANALEKAGHTGDVLAHLKINLYESEKKGEPRPVLAIMIPEKTPPRDEHMPGVTRPIVPPEQPPAESPSTQEAKPPQ